MRDCLRIVFALMFVPSSMWAVDADDVTFDDANTFVVTGANVQTAIESADATLDELTDVDGDAAVVLLREDCTGLGNCFETMAALSDPATGWIWNTRSPSPSASAPLLVDIGPGEFGAFECEDGGHVTLRGSGREISVLSAEIAADIKNCDDLSFIALGFHGTRYAVRWDETGTSSWSNVDLFVTGSNTFSYTAGWFDGCDPETDRSVHYFHGSRVRNEGGETSTTVGYDSECGETWFFGGEIMVVVSNEGTAFENGVGVSVGGFAGEFRAFGTAIRVSSVGDTDNLTGIKIGGASSIVHLHGSVVNVAKDPADTSSDSVYSIEATAAGFIHTPGTAYVIKGNGGDTRRIKNSSGATIQAPFLWQSGSYPPMAANENNVVKSKKGQDIWVETDCDSTGNCNAKSDPHLMIYTAGCGASNPWFDVVTGACRL